MNFDAEMMEKCESWGRCKICDKEDAGEEEGEEWQAQILIRIYMLLIYLPITLLLNSVKANIVWCKSSNILELQFYKCVPQFKYPVVFIFSNMHM